MAKTEETKYSIGVRFGEGDREWRSRYDTLEGAFDLAEHAFLMPNPQGRSPPFPHCSYTSSVLPDPIEVNLYAERNGGKVKIPFQEIHCYNNHPLLTRRIEKEFEDLADATAKPDASRN